MHYSNCPKCGKMFTRIKSPICPEFTKKDDEMFQVLKNYLDENPGKGINAVSRDTGISIKKILKYIQEGRVEMTAGIAVDNPLSCMRCGTPVSVGTLCDECRIQYSHAVKDLREDSARARNAKAMGTGMHSMHNEEKKRR